MEATRKAVTFGMAAVLVAVVSVLLMMSSAQPAYAAEKSSDLTAVSTMATADSASSSKNSKKDILLGMFTESADNWTNNIFASYGGRKMYRLASVYSENQGHPYSGNHWAQQCPSIMYHKGFFWSLSAYNDNHDGKFYPMISYSKDLVHWTHPDGGTLWSGTNGIKLNALPTVDGRPYKEFDVVAPEWSKTAKGEIYIVFTAGFYGDYHGRPTEDQMQAYTVKVTKLSASKGSPDGSSGYLWPSNMKFKAQKAKKLAFSNYDGANYIDGQIFTDKGKDYLIIKRDGLTNELYKTSNIAKPNKWKLVNPNMVWGYEGASVAKANKKYYFFGDGVLGTYPVGVKLVTSKSLTKKSSWGNMGNVKFLAKGGKQLTARHGTVITLKAGTKEWKVAKKLLDKKMK